MEATTYVAHDDLPNIFAGVGILPVQFGESRRRKLPSEGERKLLFAVLEDAIRCYLRHRDGDAAARTNEEFVEAAEWLSSDEDSGPFYVHQHLRGARHRRGFACAWESQTIPAAWKRSAADEIQPSARVNSSSRSRQCSVPTEMRTNDSVIPAADNSSGDSSL